MKMFRVALISKKSYRGVHHNLYRALVLANDKDEALAKVEAELKKPLKEYGDGFVKVTETTSDVYTF